MAIVTGVVVGIVVAIAGAAANYFLTKWRDERHWEREDDSRYHAERLEAYARFLRTVQVGRVVRLSSTPTPEEVLSALSDGYAETLLLSTPPVRDVAMRLFRAHVRATGHNMSDPPTEEERQSNPKALVESCMVEFEEEVKKELKIPVSRSSEAEPRPER